MVTHRLTLADVLRTHVATRPDRFAIGDGEWRLTWREFDARVNRCAQALHAAGVGAGDRVLWLGQNSFRIQELLLATAKLGAMLCPANWRQQPDELAFVIDDLRAKVVVWQREEVGDTVLAGRARAQHGDEARWLVHDDDSSAVDSYEQFVAAAPSSDDPGLDGTSDAPVLMIYTAAFGGRPNAAMLSSRALIAQALLMSPWMDIDANAVFLNSGPLFHIGTFMHNFAAFVSGGGNVFLRRNDGDALCQAIEQFRCTDAYIVGPMVQGVIDANREGRYDLSTLRGHRGIAEFDRWVTANNSSWSRSAGGYGQTEVNGMCTFNLLGFDGIGTHGRVSPLVQVRVVDPDDRSVVTGETGEIVVRGATVMNGYWNRPELNVERSRGGWHHTNDLGRFEVDGSFSFIGPKTRMLKSAAENIYPAEVEGALKAHPAVADAAIIGVPDEKWVQSVKAIVVLREGMTTTPEELIDHCRSLIASYKKPRTIEFIDALPRQDWLVDYDALDERFGGGGYPGGRTRST